MDLKNDFAKSEFNAFLFLFKTFYCKQTTFCYASGDDNKTI